MYIQEGMAEFDFAGKEELIKFKVEELLNIISEQN